MAQTKAVSASRREDLAYLSDALLLLASIFGTAGWLIVTNESNVMGWIYGLTLWLISLYLFAASVVVWIRRN